MNEIEDELVRILAEEIRREIDSEVLYKVYTTSGWFGVEIDKNFPFSYNKRIQMDKWLAENITGKFHIASDSKFAFENQQDAFLFKLRWA